MCLLLAEKYDLPKLKILSMVFLGLMSFTKNEGLIAAGIAALLIFWHERSHKKEFKGPYPRLFDRRFAHHHFYAFLCPQKRSFHQWA